MTLDWADILLLAVTIAATGGIVVGWAFRSRQHARELAALRNALQALQADPQPAMVAFLAAGTEVLKVQANTLHHELTRIELEVARKRKRLTQLTKDGQESDVAFQQNALALLHRKLVEYQEVARQLRRQSARTALFRTRLESGDLNAALASRYKAEADASVAAARADEQARLREVMADPRNRRGPWAPNTLLEWRARAASAQRQAIRLKPRLAR